MSRFSSTEPRRYLIVIGSPYCPAAGFDNLLHVQNDVQKITELFKEQGYESALYLVSDASDRIKYAVGNWFSTVDFKPSDCVVIYYAGHAYHEERAGYLSGHYLLTIDSKLEELNNTAILTEQWVRTFFQKHRDQSPRNILLILDTCYANAGARDVNRVVSQMKGATPAGSGFWIICSADANTEAGDGAFVDALCTVMDPAFEKFQTNEEFISIGDLIKQINQQLKNGQQAEASASSIRGKEIFIRHPRLLARNGLSPQEMQGREKRSSELVNCLWSLNYKSQARMFEDHTSSSIFEDHTSPSRRATAFMVQAKDDRIQRWLVKRLFNQLPNVRNAQVFSFVIPAHPMWKHRDFDELWIDLGKQLKCAAESMIVLDKLVEIYQTKPVILAMYEWQGTSRSQQLQKQVLTDFWQPLVEKVKDLPIQPSRSRLVLFLAEGATKAPEGPNNSNLLIRLAPLTEIARNDIADWLDSQSVNPVLRQVRSEDEIATLIEQEIGEWDADPVQTLQQICYVFDLENGIADIESEWRLVG